MAAREGTTCVKASAVLAATAAAQSLLAAFDALPAVEAERAGWIAGRLVGSWAELEPPGVFPADLSAWARMWRAFFRELTGRGTISLAEYALVAAMIAALERQVRQLAS
jgi:hypothetical protein